MRAPTEDYEKLGTAEKILRLQDEWDRIAEDPDAVEVTEVQKQELDSRLAAMEKSPGDVTPWAAVKAELRARR